MSYLESLHLKEEPFSNSPDPEFFYESHQHMECLRRLEISIRLMRGLNVVLGEVGAGKSTLCRLLLRALSRDQRVKAFLLLDPQFSTGRAFVEVLHRTFLNEEPTPQQSEWEMKDAIKSRLLTMGVEEKKLVVLIIDEGQKISHSCLEVLRELLNYETNHTKLLQIVIFAQTEFEAMVRKYPNVADRINEYTILGPMTFRQTRDLIRHRVRLAGYMKDKAGGDLFTLLGYYAVHRLSGGYPRKIIRLCHKSVLGCVVQKKRRADWRLVHDCAREFNWLMPKRYTRTYAMAAAAFLLAAGLALGGHLFLDRPGASSADALPQEHGQPLPSKPESEGLAPSQPRPDDSNGLALQGDEVRGPVRQSHRAETRQDPPAETATPAETGASQHVALQGGAAEPGVVREQTPPSVALPAPMAIPTLGGMTLTREMDLTALLQLVYGEVSPLVLERFLAVNPGLDREVPLARGATVTLPAAVVGEDVAPVMGYVVQITQDDSLQLAVDAARGLREQGVDVTIAAHKLDATRHLFTILQAEAFQDESAAARSLRLLPALFQNGAKVVQDPHRKGELTLASFRRTTALAGPGSLPGEDRSAPVTPPY